jgi:membrane protease YdiL (CAAX protease family)
MAISALSQSQTSAASNEISFETIKKNLCNPERWLYLIPTVGAIAVGIFFAPNFALGLAAGGAMFMGASIVLLTLNALGVIKEDPNNEYEQILDRFPLLGTLAAPLGEELVFRGALQPLLTRAVVFLAPTAAAAFLGTGLSIAAAVSIAVTATLFGLIHISNLHANSHIQAVIAAVQGVALGIIAVQFGLAASIAAHMAVNTLASLISRATYQESETATSTAPSTRQMMRV